MGEYYEIDINAVNYYRIGYYYFKYLACFGLFPLWLFKNQTGRRRKNDKIYNYFDYFFPVPNRSTCRIGNWYTYVPHLF